MNPSQNDMNSFFELAIRPFLEPFYDLLINTVPKLAISLLAFVIMIITTITEIVETPIEYWIGLMVFVIADLIAALIRLAMDSKSFRHFFIRFEGGKFKRTAYKLVVYPFVLIIAAIYTNIFPEVFWLFQYVVVAILMGSELFSIFRHLHMLPTLYKAMEFIKKKNPADLMPNVPAEDEFKDPD